MPHLVPLSRRQFLGSSAAALSLAAFGKLPSSFAADEPRLKVAAILTEFTYRSHAHVILENFLEPYYFNGKLTYSGMDVVGMYVDQSPDGTNMAPDVSKKYGIPIFPTIGETLRVGGDKLAVDAVLSIGEHGKYPSTDRGQIMYPRKRFFDEIVAEFRRSGRVVPLFNDKHLSYRWDWAAEMVETARELGIPFMAGSSVPLAQRRPPLELPSGAVIEEAVSVHGGPPEVYDFHGLEVLQSMVEARKGGETGVREVQLLEGDAVWKAAAEGRWNLKLAEAAMQAEAGKPVGPLRDYSDPVAGKNQAIHVILVTYNDGLKAAVLRIGSSATRWNFACRLAGKPEPLATSLYVGPWQNRNLFKALSHAIQTHFRRKQAPYPVERTLLVTGMLAAAMDSRFEDHKPLPTPQLSIAYSPRDYRDMREMGETWKIITEDQPQPEGINPGGPRPKA